MRRSVAAVALALSTALTVTSVAASSSTAAGGSSTGSTAAAAQARQALRTATHVLAGRPSHTSATLALLRLRLSMSHLSGEDRRHAAAILARPTDHPDFNGETYKVPAKKKCRGHICIHWVPTTKDAPPDKHWVVRMLKMMDHVWSYEVGTLGYRKPLSDGHRGGNGKFDVYLKELHHQGLYGLTTAERPTSYSRRLFSSYLLLDNDFARRQYHANPMATARVTAAHEFFHAIQFGYDAREDSWLLESTATWMEDQFDDAANDNRQYLRYGQLAHPDQPLDTFQPGGFAQYGDWPFFEYLSEHFGRGVVKSVWNHAAVFHGGGHDFSAQAIRAAVHHDGGLTGVFARYAAASTEPAHAYQEGKHFPSSGFVGSWTLSKATPSSGWQSFQVHHLASVSVRAVPGADLAARAWQLRVKVNGPRRAKMPAAYVLVHRSHHRTGHRPVHLNRRGFGRLRVPFSHAGVHFVSVTLANTSTKFHGCGHGRYSCQGSPDAAHPTFAVQLTATKH
jgi:hypothetical protein